MGVVHYVYSKTIPQTTKKKRCWIFFFGQVFGLQHPNLLKWGITMSAFLGIT